MLHPERIMSNIATVKLDEAEIVLGKVGRAVWTMPNGAPCSQYEIGGRAERGDSVRSPGNYDPANGVPSPA